MPPRRKTVVSLALPKDDDEEPTRSLRSTSAKATDSQHFHEEIMGGSTPKRSDAHKQKPLTAWSWETPQSATPVERAKSIATRGQNQPQGVLHMNYGPTEQQQPPSTQATGAAEFSIPLSLQPAEHAKVRSGCSAVQPIISSQHYSPATGTKRKSVIDLPSDEIPGSKRTSISTSSATDARALTSPVDSSPKLPCTRSKSVSTSILAANATSGAIPDTSLNGIETISRSNNKRGASDPNVVSTLPARKVFSIQVGDRLFQLSGQSISSDGPSYLTNFFEEQIRNADRNEGLGTLYVDRDPETFRDIALHLQGYHVEPRDGPHFVKLFADAQYFSLPQLTSQLFTSAIYIRIGDTDFHIPRDLFDRPGDSPNFFSLDISVFFTTPSDRGTGSNTGSLLRPPSILPPSVPNRSAKTFADLLHILKGYDIEIRNEQHRAELLRDARYFHLKGLEQRLIHHDITYNLARQRSEIRIRIEDLRQSGISFVPDSGPSQPLASPSPATSSSGSSTGQTTPGWVFYQRPYVDKESHVLVVEISGAESATMSIAPAAPSAPARIGRVTFYSATLARISSLLSVVATRLGLPSIQPLGTAATAKENKAVSLPASPVIHNASFPAAGTDERVKARIGPDADVRINGRRWIVGASPADEGESTSMEVEDGPSTSTRPQASRKASESGDNGLELVLRRSQCRVRIQPAPPSAGRPQGMEAILGAVKLDAFTNERARNADLDFLR